MPWSHKILWITTIAIATKIICFILPVGSSLRENGWVVAYFGPAGSSPGILQKVYLRKFRDE